MKPIRHSRRQAGFTLIELMISLVLGLLVVAAAGGLFLTNRQVYAANETVNRMQESSRTAFELMSRDIREAGATPCMTGLGNTVNMLTNAAGSALWQDYGRGLSGTDGANGDTLTLYSGTGSASMRITEHSDSSATLNVSSTAGIAEGDVLLACNPELSVIFMVTGVTDNGPGIEHDPVQGQAINGVSNADSRFFFDNECLTNRVKGNTCHYCFVPKASNPNSGNSGGGSCGAKGRGPAVVARLSGVRWELRNNGRGSRSLYRVPLSLNSMAAATPVAGAEAEVAEGVTNMQLTYKMQGSNTYQDASSIAGDAWKNVEAVRMVLTLSGVQGAMSARDVQGTDGAVLTRTMTNTVAIRNREGVL